MSNQERESNHQWRESNVTINAINCLISFYQPIMDGSAAIEVPRTPDRQLPSVEKKVKSEDSFHSPGSSVGIEGRLPSEDAVPCSVPRPTNDELKDKSGKGESELPTLLKQFGVKRDLAGGGDAGSDDASTIPQKYKKQRIQDAASPSKTQRYYRNRTGLPVTPPKGKEVEDFYRRHSEKLPQKKSHGKPHEWSFEEREALCLLYMFYKFDLAFEDVAKVMNEYFYQPLVPFRGAQLRSQWGTCRYVFRRRSVYDPRQAWADKRARFEAAASHAGVDLKLRSVQLKEKKLSPKFTKSAELVAAKDAWFIEHLLKSKDTYTSSTSTQDSPLASLSLNINDDSLALQLLDAAASNGPSTPDQRSPKQDSTDVPDDSPTLNTPYRPSQNTLGYPPASSQQTQEQRRPALLYRVYHDKSGGLNSPTQFRAGLFNIPGQSLEPPPAGSSILPVFVSWHLWHHTISSPFISCTDSLIMAVHKARQAEADGLNPHLAIIDGAAACGQGFHAGPLVSEARRRGLVPGMRYKGFREYLIWGGIGAERILHDLPFAALRSLPAGDMGVADLLALDDIDPSSRTRLASVRRALLRQEVVLDKAAGGHAVGRLVALLSGLDLTTAARTTEAGLPMVEQLVYDVFQGWVLGAVEGEVAEMAEAFVVGFRDAERRAAHGGDVVVLLDEDEEEGLREAFVSAVLRALEELKKERRGLKK